MGRQSFLGGPGVEEEETDLNGWGGGAELLVNPKRPGNAASDSCTARFPRALLPTPGGKGGEIRAGSDNCPHWTIMWELGIKTKTAVFKGG